MYRRARLSPGETLVVFGASGGAGGAALCMGKALGARVIAVGSDMGSLSPSNTDEFIDYRAGNVYEKVRQLTNGRGADVYFDPVGGEMFDQAMRAIAPGGRILVVGFTSGKPASVRTNVALVKMISIIGVEGRLAIEQTGVQGWNDFHMMLEWINQGKIGSQPSIRYGFSDALEAFRDLRNRQAKGKLIVEI
ncbi:MAG: zinc-binding dehydrogenase [Caenibius sp.]